ncbi:MAG TPA: hypothetical protein VFK68_06480 [Propionibacteriaceae bacterium]|nr:hypothetical protein [Propionibacteriaceae bacterium]
MHRRTLLLAALGLAAAGCSVSDPRVKGSPQPVYTPLPPVPPVGADHLAGLEAGVGALLSAMAGAPWAGPDAPRFQLLADLHRVHQAVLATADPLLREPAAVALATVPAPGTRDDGLAAAGAALTTLHDAHAALAVQTTGPLAAFWAAQAASAVQSRSALTMAVSGVTKTVPLREVAVLDATAAADDLLNRYHEAVYGLESALGRLTIAHPSRAALNRVVLAVKTQRDMLMARSRAASRTPVPGAPAYSIPATTSDVQVLALGGQLLLAVTEAAAVVVASATSELRTAVDDLVTASTLGLPLGMGMAEYPGWPDA